MTLKRKLLEQTIGLFFREMLVASAHEIAPRYWRIDLESESLQEQLYEAGDKIQVLLDDGTRTYTPFAADSKRGSLSIVAYSHAARGPGSLWGPAARPGDRVLVLGPRHAVSLAPSFAPLVLAGDETSFGTARAARERSDSAEPTLVFEVDSVEAARLALEHLQLSNATLVARRPYEQHMQDLCSNVRSALSSKPNALLALTGRAGMIQSVRRATRDIQLTHRVRAKAYWSPGKKGLD